MGTPMAAAVSLRRLLEEGHEVLAVYAQPDRPSGRGNKIIFSAVKQVAIEYGLSVRQPVKIKTPEALAEFTSHGADVAVVVAYGRILPDGFLAAFPKGAINVHFSLLPKYRGAAPVNWAIANGESRTGVTTIKMDAGLDTGNILLQRETEIGNDETAPDLMERLSILGSDVLIETLARLDSIAPEQQCHEEASFAPIMKKDDGRIDWNRPASEIANRVRGFQPFPGSFTFVGDKRIVIWRAKPVEHSMHGSSLPGQIVYLDGTLIVVAGGGTYLGIDEIQFEGKRRVAASEAIHGGSFQVGKRFA